MKRKILPDRLGAGPDLTLPLPFPGSSPRRAEGCSAFHLPLPTDEAPEAITGWIQKRVLNFVIQSAQIWKRAMQD